MSNIVKEFEARIMLTEEEYLNIVSFYMKQYPNQHFLQNVNIYFDSDDLFLRTKHITLRVRIINDARCELTLKERGSNGDKEINDDLSKQERDMLLDSGIFPNGNVKKYLIALSYPLSNYKVITTLYNRRLEIAFEDHTLCIDKNQYSDIVDYNLEVEALDSIEVAKTRINEYIKQFNLKLHMQKYAGKASRAIMAAIKKA